MTSPDLDTVVAPRPRSDEPRDADSGDGLRTPGQRRVTVELWLILCLLALGSAARGVDSPSPFFLPALQAFGAAVLPPVVIAVGAAWSGRWRMTAAAAALALVQIALVAPTWLPTDRPTDSVAGEPLVVMASNLRFGLADVDTVIATVDRLGVDVLLLSEATPGALRRLRAAGIADRLPHAVARAREEARGALVFSRHPLRQAGVPPVPPTIFEMPAVRVLSPAGDIVALAAHPVPPWPGSSALWHAELRALAYWAGSVPASTPLVVAGDFNATAAHPALRRFGHVGLRDAHSEAGVGPVTTWPRFALPVSLPLDGWLHLDHVLARGLVATDAGVVRIPGSDHDAVWAELTPFGD